MARKSGSPGPSSACSFITHFSFSETTLPQPTLSSPYAKLDQHLLCSEEVMFIFCRSSQRILLNFSKPLRWVEAGWKQKYFLEGVKSADIMRGGIGILATHHSLTPQITKCLTQFSVLFAKIGTKRILNYQTNISTKISLLHL